MTIPPYPIVSFCIPTRHRVDRLVETLKSIRDSATIPGSYEVILRVACDDSDTICEWDNIMDLHPVRMIIGYPMDGYPSVTFFHDEASRLARGKWLWQFNDDAILLGKGWDDQLQRLPLHGVIPVPEVNQLNTTRYVNNMYNPFPCVPGMVWRKFGFDEPAHPIDNWLDALLRVREGWKTHWLKGITIHHDRKP